VGTTAAWDFVALSTGQLVIIKAQTKVANPTATAIRLGIYANSASAPAGLLGVASVDNLTVAQGTDVFQATLGTSVSIVSGTTYWLGMHASTENFDFQGDAGGNYKETTTPQDFPDPFGAFGTSTVNAIIWGEDIPSISNIPNVIQAW
jgi:hypothetical protein